MGRSINSRSRQRNIIRQLVTYIGLIVLGTAFTLPFFWLLTTSFKPDDRIQRWPPDIIPLQHLTARVDGKTYRVYDVEGRKGANGRVLKAVILKRLPRSMVLLKPVNDDGSGTITVSSDKLSDAMKAGFTWRNYKRGLDFGRSVADKGSTFSSPFFRQLRNTLIVCIFSVIGTVLSCSLVAYGLSKIEWKGRETLFVIVLSTMMLPYQVIMVPIFAIFVWLGWIDTFLPLTIPTFLGNAFYIFLLRQFFMTIPKDLSEAAKLDGCSEFDIYRRVITPLTKPALATVGLFTFMNAWNDFVGPLIYLVDESKYTLSLGLSMFLGQYGNEYGMLMAVSTIVTIPIIVLFFFTQRTFIQGITMSGIKG